MYVSSIDAILENYLNFKMVNWPLRLTYDIFFMNPLSCSFREGTCGLKFGF